MAPATAVVIDSDQTHRDDIRVRLSHCGVLPICFKDEWIGLENIHHIRPAFAVFRPESRATAARFINLAQAIRRTFPIIILSNQHEIESLVRNNLQVNLFFLHDPADDQEFQNVITLLDQSTPEIDRPVLIAGSPGSQKRIECLPLLGMSKEPLLVLGEPGVGKRLMVKAIHAFSTAGHSDLEGIDARDITEGWIGEMRNRVKASHGADGNDFFCVIENIENLAADLQSLLLPIIETPLTNGSANGVGQSVRFITVAATDLERLSREGRFRKDLYHRISVLKLILPPLRERRDDVPALADFFTAKYSIQTKGAFFRLSDEVRTRLKNYDWPGNISELKHAIKQSLAAHGGNWTGDLAAWRSHPIGTRSHPSSAWTIDANDDVRRFLENNRNMPLKKAKQRYAMQVEIRIMKAALSKTNGNRKKAAGLLNISYKSMLNKAKAYQLV